MTTPDVKAGNIKGVSVLAAKHFVLQRGPTKWSELIAKLRSDDANVIASAVPVGWYPVTSYKELLRVLDEHVGSGDKSTLAALGRFQAEHDLNHFYRFVLRFWSPAIVVEKVAELWTRYHDTGTWNVRREGDHAMVAAVSGWMGADDRTCAATVAYIVRLFELVGAKEPRVAHPECIARGDSRCQFDVEWR